MLAVLAAVLGLVLLLLALPVGVSFRLRGVEPLEARVRVRLLLGLVRLRVRLPRAPRERPERPRRERASGPRAGRGGRGALAAIRDAPFRRRALRLLRDLLGATHPSGFRLYARLGLGDPADTGRLWAVVGPLSAAAMGVRGADVRIEPEFVDPVLELDASGRLSVVPLQVLAIAVAFALSPDSIRAWRAVRASRA